MPNSQPKRLFLLDAYALIFRGYYAFIKNPRINSKGLNTSAIMGFSNSLLDLIKRENPTHLAVVFDVGKQTIRHEYFTDYKANRDETPEPIKIAVPYIQEILKALKIPILYAEGYEADDVIGTLAKKAEADGFMVFMMTPDKDFAQLVSNHIKIYKPASRGGGIEVLGIEEVKEKFKVQNPIQVIDLLGMMGDSVDNIPGLPGVGEKTAQKFIAQYGSLENLLENTHELKGKIKEKIEANKDLGILSKKLATILTDAPVEFNPNELTVDEPDFERIKELFHELEFRRMLENLYKTYNKLPDSTPQNNTTTKVNTSTQTSLFDDYTEESHQPPTSVQTNIENTPHHYQHITTKQALKVLTTKLLQQNEVCFDCETTSLNALEANLVGISFSYQTGKAYYVQIPTDFTQAKEWVQELKALFKAEQILKVGQNLKYDIKVLYKYGIEDINPIFDTMIAHYLINPDMRHNLNVLAETYLNYTPISIESLIGKKGKNQGSFSDTDPLLQTEYAGEDADITLQLKQIFQQKLTEINATNLFNQIEIPLVNVLAQMEKNGIHLDAEILKQQSLELEKELTKYERIIYQESASEFNINSPKQLGEILFDKMKLIDKPKKTKTGQYATSEDILQKLIGKHKIIENILEYRQIQKLKSTYVDALPKEINPSTNRVHTIFAQTVAATGRLASNNPNLQNIPIRTTRGQKVREAFTAKDSNHVLLAADYSQIELRLIAHMSQDPEMLQAFKQNKDIHTTTAAKVFGITEQAVTRQQRSQAKTVNFGIIYGVSAFGLSEQTGLSRAESKDLIDTYYQTYPTLKSYMNQQIEIARTKGYVETLLGRRRYLQDIHSNNHLVRSHAERNAINAPIQGSAADIIKLAMIQLSNQIQKSNYQTKMLLQVHDELVFECPISELEEIKPIIKNTMQNCTQLSVPLIVDCGYGKNWLEAH